MPKPLVLLTATLLLAAGVQAAPTPFPAFRTQEIDKSLTAEVGVRDPRILVEAGELRRIVAREAR